MIAAIMEKMITCSDGNIHDIDHLIRVWTYAKTIGELEGLDNERQFILEVAAVTHDIACPLCREKYGNTDGKNQEKEGGPLVRELTVPTGRFSLRLTTSQTLPKTDTPDRVSGNFWRRLRKRNPVRG